MGLAVMVPPSRDLYNGTKPLILGATIYDLGITYFGPSRGHGPDEIVVEVVRAYTGLVKTDQGNLYSNGDFGIRRFAEEQSA